MRPGDRRAAQAIRQAAGGWFDLAQFWLRAWHGETRAHRAAVERLEAKLGLWRAMAATGWILVAFLGGLLLWGWR